MGKRGPQPQPVELRKLRGNPGKRAMPNPPKGEVVVISCPARLAEHKKLWDKYATILEKIGILRETDALAYECLFDCLAIYIDHRDKGEAREQMAAARELRTWMQHFGLTPSSRSSIGIEAPKEEDEFTAFLKSQKKAAEV